MHWGINYLREDLQDIRLDVREIRVEMQARFAEVQGQFGAVQSQFGQMQKQMDSRFFWTLGFVATMTAMQMALMTALIKL